jgi:uncharacterized protein involved in exopolysaccharide biosynthesis
MSHPSSPPAGPGRRPSPDEHTDLFELARLWEWAGFAVRAPLRHPRIALAAFLAMTALGFVAVAVVPMRWEVTATVLAQRSALMGTLSNPGMNREWDAPTRAARELLLRRENLIALCKQTNFVERYLATRAPSVRLRDWIYSKVLRRQRTHEQLLEGLADALESRLWINVVAEGTLSIGFSWSDKELAFQIVQAAIQTFMEERYATEIKMVGETITILEGHDARVQKEIASTIARFEEKERTFRTRSAPRISVMRPHAPDEDMARLESTLAARRRAMADLEEFRRQRLAELQTQLAQQLGVYAPEHPLVISTRRAIDAGSGPSPQIEVLRLEVIDLENQIKRRGGRVDPAASAAAAMRGEWAAAARLRLEAEDPRLEYERRQLDLLLRQHSALLERIDSARIEMDTAQAAFKYRYSVVTPPQLPRSPAKPYVLLFIGGGIAGGIALAMFLSTAADLRAGRIVERWQVEQQLDLAVLSEIEE